MFKRILMGAVVLLALLLLIVSLPIASVGRVLYPAITSFEASLYGLKSREVKVSDTTLVVYTNELQPDRETIVLLHGFSSDRFIFARFAKHFSDDYNLILPDLAGHGDSPYDPALPYTFSAQARRVAELLEALDLDDAHVAGNSMGGGITAHFAIAYAEKIRSAGLFNAAGLTSPTPSDMDRMLADGRNPFEVQSRNEFKEFYAMTMHRPPYLPGSLLAFTADEYQRRRPELQVMFHQVHGSEPLDERLGDIAAPTLVVWGAHDRLLHVSAAEVFHRGVPDASLVVFDDYGHMPQFEAPAESAAAYRRFIEGVQR